MAKQPTEENIKESIELLEKAVKLDPKNELSKITLAQLKLQSNEIEDAIKLFEEASYLTRTYEEKITSNFICWSFKNSIKNEEWSNLE